MTEPAPVAVEQAPRHRWYHVAMALVFIVFCMEVGMFLVLFPWSDFWDRSFFSWFPADWRLFWDNTYLRGAISGLGLVNVYISLLEVFRLRRFARH